MNNKKILIADPPWPGKIQRPNRGAKYEKLPDYPRLPLPVIAGKLNELEKSVDASLVWCIDKFLKEELERGSPLKIRRTLIWYKAHAGIGWNVRYAHEYIIARWNKGYRTHFNLPSVIVGPRTDHNFLTSKPISILTSLVGAFASPDGKVLEAFKGSRNLEFACKIIGCQYEDVTRT